MNESAAAPGDTIRKTIIQRVIEIYKNSPTLTDEEIVAQAEAETKAMFDGIRHQPPVPSAPTSPTEAAHPLAKTRGKRRGREDRKDHVGRFFLTLVDKQLKEEKIMDCLIPVFAKSLQVLIGDEAYNKFAQKTAHLLEFAAQKNFDYDQVLQSKPGKQIMEDLMVLYRSEMVNSKGFAEQMKNKLDQALVQNMAKLNEKDPEHPLNIEEEVNKAYNSFIRTIAPKKK